jgi:ABC-type Fe3+/spermidine/putrescine transport system ATPase subunit
VLSPDVLLLDEPLSNLDAKIRQSVRAEIRKLQKELAITSIYVTHDQEEALTISDRIAVLSHEKVQQIGTPRDLYEKPQNPFVADFIGINNLIRGDVMAVDEPAGAIAVQTPFGSVKCLFEAGLRAGSPCMISVRPETASIRDPGYVPEAGTNIFSGRVSFASYIGNAIRYDIDLGVGTMLKVDVQNPWHQQPYPLDAQVAVCFPVQITLGVPMTGEKPARES